MFYSRGVLFLDVEDEIEEEVQPDDYVMREDIPESEAEDEDSEEEED